MTNKKQDTKKILNSLRLGDLILESENESMINLINFSKVILSDEVLKEYLNLQSKNSILGFRQFC